MGLLITATNLVVIEESGPGVQVYRMEYHILGTESIEENVIRPALESVTLQLNLANVIKVDEILSVCQLMH